MNDIKIGDKVKDHIWEDVGIVKAIGTSGDFVPSGKEFPIHNTQSCLVDYGQYQISWPLAALTKIEEQ